MAENPYAPPGAQVADPAAPGTLRPAAVRIALVLLWISLTASVPEAIAELTTDIPETDRAFYFAWISGAMVLVFALFIALILCMGWGHRWARFVYGLQVVVSYSLAGEYFRDSFELGAGFGALYVLQLLCDVGAMVLLFLPASNHWFRTARTRAT